MSLYIKTEDTKFRVSRITIETALELYEGGLYKMLQEEYSTILRGIEFNKGNVKMAQATLKKYEALGIKAPKEQ